MFERDSLCRILHCLQGFSFSYFFYQMGILEQILEANKSLSEQLNSLSSEVLHVKQEIETYKCESDKLKLEFSDDDILNASMTAKILGIKQTELDGIISKGLLHSVGERKRIFLAKDVADFLKYRDNHFDTCNIPLKAKKQKKKAGRRNSNKIGSKQMEELIKLNSSD